MRSVEYQFGRWLDLVDQLLKQPPNGGFPRHVILRELATTFDTRASWNWFDSDGGLGFEMPDRPSGWPLPDEFEFWRTEAMPLHLLVRWFAAIGDPTAMTIARVPSRMTSPRGSALVREHLSPVDLEQQLTLPYEMTATAQRSFVLARGGADFDDADLGFGPADPAAAHAPRPAVPGDRRCAATGPVTAAQLSGREVAVLRLLGDGLTAVAIGRRLGSSPRPVQKHLEHVYRKLGVSDRLLAVRVAHDLGLLRPLTDQASGASSGVARARSG